MGAAQSHEHKDPGLESKVLPELTLTVICPPASIETGYQLGSSNQEFIETVKILRYLRKICLTKFSQAIRSGILGPFPPPQQLETVTADISCILAACLFIRSNSLSGRSDKDAEILQTQALAIVWFVNFLIGSNMISDEDLLFFQQQRSIGVGDPWTINGQRAREATATFTLTCQYARGLGLIFCQAPAFSVARKFLDQIDRVESTLKPLFSFIAEAKKPPQFNPAVSL